MSENETWNRLKDHRIAFGDNEFPTNTVVPHRTNKRTLERRLQTAAPDYRQRVSELKKNAKEELLFIKAITGKERWDEKNSPTIKGWKPGNRLQAKMKLNFRWRKFGVQPEVAMNLLLCQISRVPIKWSLWDLPHQPTRRIMRRCN